MLFCDDFRIEDNPALYKACIECKDIVLLYVYDESYLGRKIGAASKVFLHKCLESFSNLLAAEYGANLILRKGDTLEIVHQVYQDAKFQKVFLAKSYTPKQQKLEARLIETFGLNVNIVQSKILFQPESIKNKNNKYFQVFTPFSKECLKKTCLIGDALPKPSGIKSINHIESLPLSALDLLPKDQGEWHLNLIKKHEFDYATIDSNFGDFLAHKLAQYPNNRNIPSANGNAGISAYLRFGMLSPRRLFLAASLMEPNNQFVLELLWREFAYHALYYNQDIHLHELRAEYSHFKWDNNVNYLKKWQKGETGYRIVDAGMKELYATGTMHNRVRMITASFLIKDLLIDWKIGEKWFWDTLIDADVAINPFSWQWVFGSGFDAAPYFRIFNPEMQAKKFDPDNEYCLKWNGKNYNTKTIVEHENCRTIALQRYKEIKQ